MSSESRALAGLAIIIIIIAVGRIDCREMKYSSKYSGNNVFLKSVDQKFNLNLESSIREDIAKLRTNSTSDFGADLNHSESDGNSSVTDKALIRWPARIFSCMRSLSVLRCFKIFLLGRVNRVLTLMRQIDSNETVADNFEVTSELANELNWEQFKTIKESKLDDLIIEGVKDLFKNKTTKLIIFPGVTVDVEQKENASIILNVMKDRDVGLPRGNKLKNGFNRILPFLLIPPLIMSAILPFVLPALKLMIFGVGLINQVAFWGAVLTLMRNNAFSDKYEKKVVYINEGYLNEHRPPSYISKTNYFSRKKNGPNIRFKPKPYKIKKFPPLTTTFYEEEPSVQEYEDFVGSNFNKHLDFSDIEIDNGEKFPSFYSSDFPRVRKPSFQSEFMERKDVLSNPIIVK